MPITAFSRTTGDELDVAQALRRLARRDGTDEAGIALESIPDAWRTEIRADMECPSCFILGAELVREGISKSGSKKVVRQACFRYPEHLPQCDFAQSSAAANSIPENLVSFGSERSGLTMAVRQLVGAGIQTGALSQRYIRDMRQWFFAQKVKNSFVVTLDPALPLWLKDLLPRVGGLYAHEEIALTKDLAALPGFDWPAAARHELRNRHKHEIDAVADAKIWVWRSGERIASLARRYQRETVFDPSPLRSEYSRTLDLSWFITQNYIPIRRFAKKGSRDEHVSCVLAFAALLLFISDWDLNRGAALFSRIALAAPGADQDLGNVMGLNPWHDFEAWSGLKALQDLNLQAPVVALAPAEELSEIEVTLRREFATEMDK